MYQQTSTSFWQLTGTHTRLAKAERALWAPQEWVATGNSGHNSGHMVELYQTTSLSEYMTCLHKGGNTQYVQHDMAHILRNARTCESSRYTHN